MTSSCEHGDGPSGSFDQLNYHYLIELLNTIMTCMTNFYFVTRAEQKAKGCGVGREVHTRLGSDVTSRGDRQALRKRTPPPPLASMKQV